METASYEMKTVDASEWRRIHAEVADLRRQVAVAQAWGELQMAIVARQEDELAALRRQLAKAQAELADVPVASISAMYDALAYATAGTPAHDEDWQYTAVRRWLDGQLEPANNAQCDSPGFTGFGPCNLPAGHEGPHMHARA